MRTVGQTSVGQKMRCDGLAFAPRTWKPAKDNDTGADFWSRRNIGIDRCPRVSLSRGGGKWYRPGCCIAAMTASASRPAASSAPVSLCLFHVPGPAIPLRSSTATNAAWTPGPPIHLEAVCPRQSISRPHEKAGASSSRLDSSKTAAVCRDLCPHTLSSHTQAGLQSLDSTLSIEQTSNLVPTYPRAIASLTSFRGPTDIPGDSSFRNLPPHVRSRDMKHLDSRIAVHTRASPANLAWSAFHRLGLCRGTLETRPPVAPTRGTQSIRYIRSPGPQAPC